MLTFHGLPHSESVVTGLGAVLFFMRASSGVGLRFRSAPLNAKRFKEIIELKRVQKIPFMFFFFFFFALIFSPPTAADRSSRDHPAKKRVQQGSVCRSRSDLCCSLEFGGISNLILSEELPFYIYFFLLQIMLS